VLSRGAPLDAGERRQVEAAARRLDLLPVSAAAAGVFDAIEPCVPVRAGLLSFIRPDAPEAMTSQAFGLAPDLFESWMRTPRLMLDEALTPLVASPAGSLLRDSETIRGERRERLEALSLLDAVGLGEGAGYKAMERTDPCYGPEHVMLALLMERGRPVPPRSGALLWKLNPAIQRAILRIGLPLLSHQPIKAQLVAEQSLGYVCLSLSGGLIETNRRAHVLVDRYAEAACIVEKRGAMAAFATRARDQLWRGAPWQLVDDESSSTLQVDLHRLDKETHLLSEDVILLQMREVPPPPLSARAARARAALTRTQLAVAMRFAATGASDKELAAELGMRVGTVHKHMEDARARLRVSSRGAVAARITR
jgi:DNA-binding CsgD family transcriptional regulator